MTDGSETMCGFLAILKTPTTPAGPTGPDDLSQLAQRGEALIDRLRHRGPDERGVWQSPHAWLGHRRLAIMAPGDGHQPLVDQRSAWVSNSEIYNAEALMAELDAEPVCASDSRCIGPVLDAHGAEGFARLDGQYAIVHVDLHTGHWMAGRDHMGICPMYLGRHASGTWWFTSEMKALIDDCEHIEIVEPGTAWVCDEQGPRLVRWYDPAWKATQPTRRAEPEAIRALVVDAVAKRIVSDAPWGVLLSGGLDSSIVASVAARIHRERTGKAIRTFSIGLDDSSDLVRAREVARHIGSEHTEFRFTIEEAVEALPTVAWHLESDQQVRTGVPTYLLGQRVRDAGFKMVLSGEGADEVFGGYLYFHSAPSPEAFHEETVRKTTRLHQYDVMRANKAPMASGVELRFPLLDRALIDHAMSLDPRERAIPGTAASWMQQGDEAAPAWTSVWQGMEKALLREAFREGDWLPDSILFRQKEQFSDGVGYGWVDALQARAEAEISDEDLARAREDHPELTPANKEMLWMRRLFEARFVRGKASGRSALTTLGDGRSVACCTPEALRWDASWSTMAGDISGRTMKQIHAHSADRPQAG